VSGGKGTAAAKIEALRKCGARVIESPAQLGRAMLEEAKKAGIA
jgi:succinyl-CoA synthetase alpha subunit